MTNAPVNLTEAAGRMPWSEVDRTLRVRAHASGATLEIRGLDPVNDGNASDGRSDTIYVIVSGYGVLRYDDKAMECTEGDVLFVPSGYPHQFEQRDGGIKMWRISLAPVENGEPPAE